MNKHLSNLTIFNILVANHSIRILTDFPLLKNMYHDYLTEAPEECEIKMSWSDIHIKANGQRTLSNEFSLRNASISTPKLLEGVTEFLLFHNTLLIHGATIAVKKQAFIFSAPSGTGKTTHIRKWIKILPESYVINGDKTFISINNDDNTITAYGSPWAGKENLHNNVHALVKSIVFMEQSDNNYIYPITFSDAFPYLLQQIYRPKDIVMMRESLELIKSIGDSVSFWIFKCNNFKDDCFDVAYNALLHE